MTTLYYRGMAEENDKPKMGRSARLLGVRPGIDIDVKYIPRDCLDNQGYLKSEAKYSTSGDKVAIAIRNTKGMSTALSIEALPNFRKPASFGGTGRDPLWQIEDAQITGDLEAVQDSSTHVSIMPKASMLLEKYEAALANTQNYWHRLK